VKTDAQIVPVAQGTHAVWVERVTFTYHGADRAALRAVSFAQAAGEMIGVMGASGAGKSTLAKCLNRIVPEFEDGDFRGAIRIAGEPLENLRVCDVAPKVGMVFQDFESQLFSTNVAHEVAFAMEQVGMDRAEMDRRIMPALEAVGLRGFEHRDPMSLSGGEKQRLAIASVLALRPSVIVLDEPTTDLDPEGRAEVFELIARLRAQGLSLIVIEHESEELRAADRIMILREGEVAADGPPAEVFARTELLTGCGVRPPGLGHALELLGIEARAESVEDAYAAIARAYPNTVATAYQSIASSRASEEPSTAAGASAGPALVGIENVSFSYAGGP
jgi:energy-coupling factor transporter ATP-binding protein EcfA2